MAASRLIKAWTTWVVSSKVFEGCTCVLFDQCAIDIDVVQRVQVFDQLVVSRLQLGTEGHHHGGERRFKLFQVHQLAALLSQVELLDFTVHTLGQNPLLHEACAVVSDVPGCLPTQVLDVGQPHFLQRGRLPVDAQLLHVARDFGLVHAEVLSNLGLCGHTHLCCLWPPSTIRN